MFLHKKHYSMIEHNPSRRPGRTTHEATQKIGIEE